jgi:hypothetical protein
MILAEENVVLAKVNSDLYARMQDLQERHRKQTEILSGLLTNADFGLPSTVLPEALPDGRALLDILDLPGVYSKLIGGIREPVANSKGLLSILAPATVATRGELVESIERQLSRPFGQDLNVANSFLNVAQTVSFKKGAVVIFRMEYEVDMFVDILLYQSEIMTFLTL